MGGHRPPPSEVASKANQSYTWAMAGRDGRKLLRLGLCKTPWGPGVHHKDQPLLTGKSGP